MLLHKRLTKENFWNKAFAKYPKACKLFSEWIDEYKEQVNWNDLFVQEKLENRLQIKFHDIPYEMQQGIWITFAHDILNKHFEQPDYTYCNDLALDIENVFNELEAILN